MSSRIYPKLAVEEFGRQLITSGDLDPIYIALYRLQLPREQLHRWLLAYWCFYNAGLASYLSEQEGARYWETFKIAAANRHDTPAPIGGGAKNGNWPRGKERRHFRGMQSIKAVDYLADRYPIPEAALVDIGREAFHTKIPPVGKPWKPEHYEVHNIEPIPFATINGRVQEWKGFGNWIAFKVGDMLDRCAGIPVNFKHSEVFFFEDPQKAALMLWKVWHGAPPGCVIDDEPAAVVEVVERLQQEFKELPAPPGGERKIGLQEIETVLCKWKSHQNGHYPLMNDIIEINEGVLPWTPYFKTASAFLGNMPKLTVAKT